MNQKAKKVLEKLEIIKFSINLNFRVKKALDQDPEAGIRIRIKGTVPYCLRKRKGGRVWYHSIGIGLTYILAIFLACFKGPWLF